MTKKSIIISVISVICLVGIVSFAMYGCSSKGGNEKKEKTGVSGQITVISREEGSGTRDAFVELMGVTDENGNDITVDSAELTNSTSVVMSTVKGNKNAIGYISLGSLSSDVKAVGLDGVAPSTVTVKDGSYKLQRPLKSHILTPNLQILIKILYHLLPQSRVKQLFPKRDIFPPKQRKITRNPARKAQSQLRVQPRSLQL